MQCDEIWAFNHCKQRNVASAKAAPDITGDIWTWAALEADTKLIVSYLVGGRLVNSYAWTSTSRRALPMAPTMQPFVIMKGIESGDVTVDTVSAISSPSS